MAYVAAIMGILSLGAGLYGQAKAAEAQKDANKYNQKVAKNNKLIAGRLAKDARDRGRVKDKEFRLDVKGMKGAHHAALAKAGVVINQDTALDLILDTAQFGDVCAQNVRANAEREAFAHEAQGEGFAAQANLDSMRSRSASSAAKINMVQTILGGSTDIYRAYKS